MKIGFDKTHYDIEAQVESSHWWFEGRRRVLKVFLSMIEAQPNRIALEVGCGTGANLKVIQSMGFLGIGLDRSNHPLGLIKEKQDLPLLLGDLSFLPIKTNSLGLIIATDVFEHLENDKKGIEECYRVLKKEGILFLTLPAFKFLWGGGQIFSVEPYLLRFFSLPFGVSILCLVRKR